MKRLDRWLAHVRKQLPGPMYDHPRRESVGMTDEEVRSLLYGWRDRQVELAAAGHAALQNWFAERRKEV